MTVGMIARPSRPSVRLTALLAPTITQYERTIKPHTPSGYDTVLKKGTMRSAFGGRSRLNPLESHARNSCRNCAVDGADTENARYTAATSAMMDCQISLARAESPRGLR